MKNPLYGLATYQANANTPVVVPRGVVYSDENGGSSLMGFIQLWIPQPTRGEPAGVHVVIMRGRDRPRT